MGEHQQPAAPAGIAVVMIVRDEAASIRHALGSVRGWAQQVVVYDTGSTDDTVAICQELGATVIQGYWDDDFARARNAALEHATQPWVLSLDADEQVRGRPESMRRILDAAIDEFGFTVQIENTSGVGDEHNYVHRAPRLFRRDGALWTGLVHEQPVRADGSTMAWSPMGPDVLNIWHSGYSDSAEVRAKAERNVAILQPKVDQALATGNLEGLPDILVDLGRSQITAGDLQGAVDAFEAVRELAPGTGLWAQATDFLARILLGDGQDEVVLVLADQLEESGGSAEYCNWLRAQALAYLGHPHEALGLLRGIERVVDPAGRVYDAGRLYEVRSLVAQLAGDQHDAIDSLVRAMAEFGRVQGRGGRLLELWGDRTAGELAALLGTPLTPELEAELRSCGPRGDAVIAAALVR